MKGLLSELLSAGGVFLDRLAHGLWALFVLLGLLVVYFASAIFVVRMVLR